MISKNIDQFLLKSRASRLALEEEQRHFNPVQRFFGWGPIGWLAKTAIQAMPSLALYGPGDVVTGLSALAGRDLLDGKKLDKVDRVLYTIATAIPGVPATILVTPMRMIRRYMEDAYHSHKSGRQEEATANTQGLIDTAKELRQITKKK